MALYDSAQYRVGYQGYFYYAAQAERLVTGATITDPEEVGSVATLVGYCALPGWSMTETRQAVETIGAMLDQDQLPSRRECAVNTRIMVADGTFLLDAIRDHADPDAAGSVNGLQLDTVEFGAATDFGAEQVWAKQGIDTLFQSLSLDYAEGQPLVATVELWPICFIPGTGQAKAVPTAQVLHWKDLSWVVDGTDYMPILAGVRLTASNNLIRVGMRQQFGALGATELAISRTPKAILPALEKLQVQYTLHDLLPATLADSDDWGAVTLRAEEPGTGAGRQYFQVVIDNNFINRYGGQQVQAGQPLTLTADLASQSIAMTTGTTEE